MTKRKGNYKPGPGRPRNGDFPNRESIRISDEQKAHLIKKYGGVTAGIRALIDASIAADIANPPRPGPKGDGERPPGE